ncbi:hypothetical protein PHAVU_010G067746 [Phaseolus vulgaris]|uniref:PPM-type phosphatase domain-containing protein n=1 Tax=Phaseolus vulgaris TaxID=3885 RepID=V7BDW6_PHAVU|nr:hypothetical protein PHAVU_007G123600g [Phaseolus vulgaris]ESW16029.1 hypothetical protein PHAVU_007G123600g [Phaseolus vulgaris]
MGFYLNLKFKAFRLKRFLLGHGGRKRKHKVAKKPSWMMPMTYGYHVVEHNMTRDDSDNSDFDSVVAQREEINQTELWYFGIFDALIGDRVSKYMQSHFFGKKLQETHIRSKSKEALKRAYLGVRAKIREEHKLEETCRMGSASVMLINGEKLVVANMGDYRTVVCRDGIAHQITGTHRRLEKIHWSRRLFAACQSGNAAGAKLSRGSDVVVRSEVLDSGTEFLILASNGIWEVMKNQEAVNLISHIEDPQEAAECLAKEALIRMTKSNISCLIIRFD